MGEQQTPPGQSGAQPEDPIKGTKPLTPAQPIIDQVRHEKPSKSSPDLTGALANVQKQFDQSAQIEQLLKATGQLPPNATENEIADAIAAEKARLYDESKN